MKLTKRPLIPILLLLLLLACGIAIAGSRSIKSSPAPVAGCLDDCKERLDKMLETCDSITGVRRDRCREAANKQYNKCAERCRGGER